MYLYVYSKHEHRVVLTTQCHIYTFQSLRIVSASLNK